MPYSIKNNRLEGPNVDYVPTKKTGGKIKKFKAVVIHYTAGINYAGDVRTLSSSPAKVSCQLVLGANGELTQIGNLNDVMWHAGVSQYKGAKGLNSYSIGIEVVCPGPVELVKKSANGDPLEFQTWSGQILQADGIYDFVHAAHPYGGPKRWWAKFTPAQIAKLLEIVPVITDHYDIPDVVGHDDITKKYKDGVVSGSRKIDPGPSCPQSLFAKLNGRNEDMEEDVDIDTPALTVYMVAGVYPDTLNFRDSPYGEIKGALPEGVMVELLEEKNNWAKVRTPAGHVGWVFARYLTKTSMFEEHQLQRQLLKETV